VNSTYSEKKKQRNVVNVNFTFSETDKIDIIGLDFQKSTIFAPTNYEITKFIKA